MLIRIFSIGVSCFVVLSLMSVLVQAQPQPATLVRWVDAGNGSDQPTSGSAAQPYNTVNYALDQVWDLLHPSVGIALQNPVEIRIAATSQAIAAVGFGGFESYGWMTPAEEAQMCRRGPFPLRMIDRVSIIGAGTAKSLIIIDEVGAGGGNRYNKWTGSIGGCGTTLDRALVLGASECRLENVEIDGTQMIDTAPPNDWPGVLVRASTDFDVVDCYVHAWHDQLTLDPGTQAYCQVDALGSVFADAWPLNPFGGAPGNSGHAAIRVEGPGDCDLYIEACRISGSHDAIELEATPGLNSVVVVDTQFLNNENGFETGGGGNVYMEAIGCTFRDNVNRGMAAGGVNDPTGAIGARGPVNVQCRVRSCRFENNTVGAYWQVGPNSVLDMGTDADPGENSFCLDHTLYPTAANPYRVCVWQRSGAGNTILAAGNYWLPHNQGAVGNPGIAGQNGRFLRIGLIPATPMVVNEPPPGPGVGCLAPSGAEYRRNYSIRHAGAFIDFGLNNPDLMPLPPSCFCCTGGCP